MLGYSATQKAFLLIEVSTGKKVVSPHVHFVWGEFPGLQSVSRGGRSALPAPPSDSGQSSVLPPADAPPPPQPPGVGPAPGGDGDSE